MRERYYRASPERVIAQDGSRSGNSEQVYNSNAIENSTLSLEETEKILLQIDLDRYSPEREIFEAKKSRTSGGIHRQASERTGTLKRSFCFCIKCLISNIRDEIAGRFRTGEERVRVGTHIAPHASEIPELMKRCSRNTTPPAMNISCGGSPDYTLLSGVRPPVY